MFVILSTEYASTSHSYMLSDFKYVFLFVLLFDFFSAQNIFNVLSYLSYIQKCFTYPQPTIQITPLFDFFEVGKLGRGKRGGVILSYCGTKSFIPNGHSRKKFSVFDIANN